MEFGALQVLPRLTGILTCRDLKCTPVPGHHITQRMTRSPEKFLQNTVACRDVGGATRVTYVEGSHALSAYEVARNTGYKESEP
jgi:hypothetical protein